MSMDLVEPLLADKDIFGAASGSNTGSGMKK